MPQLTSSLHIKNDKLYIDCDTGIKEELNKDYMVVTLGHIEDRYCGQSYNGEALYVPISHESVKLFINWEQAEQIAKAILSHVQQQQLLQMKEGELIND